MNASERALHGCLKFNAGCTLVIALIAGTWLGAAWLRSSELTPPAGFDGDPARGRVLVSTYGCTSCHVIPHAPAQGEVGPPLTHFAARSYIAGKLANDPALLVQWIEHPQSLKPGTAMPDLGVNERDARDLAAYLAQLR